jgi:hypothetical protein
MWKSASLVTICNKNHHGDREKNIKLITWLFCSVPPCLRGDPCLRTCGRAQIPANIAYTRSSQKRSKIKRKPWKHSCGPVPSGPAPEPNAARNVQPQHHHEPRPSIYHERRPIFPDGPLNGSIGPIPLRRGKRGRRPRPTWIGCGIMRLLPSTTQRTFRVLAGTGRVFEYTTFGRRCATDPLQLPEPDAATVGTAIPRAARTTAAVTTLVRRTKPRVIGRQVGRHRQHREHRQQQPHTQRPG